MPLSASDSVPLAFHVLEIVRARHVLPVGDAREADAQFAYDITGRLSSVTDVDGNVTTIQRDGGGNPTAIFGPSGQSTALAVNANGFLGQITSPAGENVHLGYTDDGLLTSLTNPRGHTSAYTFDTLGRLTSATDPTGATKTFGRSGTNKDYTVTKTTALVRTTNYRVEHLSNGSERHRRDTARRSAD